MAAARAPIYLLLLLWQPLLSSSSTARDRRFSESKRCADPECSKLMCRGKAIQDFKGPDCRFVNFKKDELIYVYHMLSGRSTDLWAGTVGIHFGYFPKDLIDVKQVYTTKELELPTDETDFVCFEDGSDTFDSYDVNELLKKQKGSTTGSKESPGGLPSPETETPPVEASSSVSDSPSEEPSGAEDKASKEEPKRAEGEQPPLQSGVTLEESGKTSDLPSEVGTPTNDPSASEPEKPNEDKPGSKSETIPGDPSASESKTGDLSPSESASPGSSSLGSGTSKEPSTLESGEKSGVSESGKPPISDSETSKGLPSASEDRLTSEPQERNEQSPESPEEDKVRLSKQADVSPEDENVHSHSKNSQEDKVAEDALNTKSKSQVPDSEKAKNDSISQGDASESEEKNKNFESYTLIDQELSQKLKTEIGSIGDAIVSDDEETRRVTMDDKYLDEEEDGGDEPYEAEFEEDLSEESIEPPLLSFEESDITSFDQVTFDNDSTSSTPSEANTTPPEDEVKVPVEVGHATPLKQEKNILTTWGDTFFAIVSGGENTRDVTDVDGTDSEEEEDEEPVEELEEDHALYLLGMEKNSVRHESSEPPFDEDLYILEEELVEETLAAVEGNQALQTEPKINITSNSSSENAVSLSSSDETPSPKLDVDPESITKEADVLDQAGNVDKEGTRESPNEEQKTENNNNGMEDIPPPSEDKNVSAQEKTKSDEDSEVTRPETDNKETSEDPSNKETSEDPSKDLKDNKETKLMDAQNDGIEQAALENNEKTNKKLPLSEESKLEKPKINEDQAGEIKSNESDPESLDKTDLEDAKPTSDTVLLEPPKEDEDTKQLSPIPQPKENEEQRLNTTEGSADNATVDGNPAETALGNSNKDGDGLLKQEESIENSELPGSLTNTEPEPLTSDNSNAEQKEENTKQSDRADSTLQDVAEKEVREEEGDGRLEEDGEETDEEDDDGTLEDENAVNATRSRQMETESDSGDNLDTSESNITVSGEKEIVKDTTSGNEEGTQDAQASIVENVEDERNTVAEPNKEEMAATKDKERIDVDDNLIKNTVEDPQKDTPLEDEETTKEDILEKTDSAEDKTVQVEDHKRVTEEVDDDSMSSANDTLEEESYLESITALSILREYLDEARMAQFQEYLGLDNLMRLEAMFQDMDSELKLARKDNVRLDYIDKALDQILEASESNILDFVESVLDAREANQDQILTEEKEMFDEEASLLDDVQEISYKLRQKHSTLSDSSVLAPGAQDPDVTEKGDKTVEDVKKEEDTRDDEQRTTEEEKVPEPQGDETLEPSTKEEPTIPEPRIEKTTVQPPEIHNEQPEPVQPSEDPADSSTPPPDVHVSHDNKPEPDKTVEDVKKEEDTRDDEQRTTEEEKVPEPQGDETLEPSTKEEPTIPEPQIEKTTVQPQPIHNEQPEPVPPSEDPMDLSTPPPDVHVSHDDKPKSVTDDDEYREETGEAESVSMSSVVSSVGRSLLAAKNSVAPVASLLVSALPEDFQPGPDFHGVHWEPVVITFLVGLLSVLIFFWRTCLSVKSRMYQVNEKQLAEKIAALMKERSEALEKISEFEKKIKEVKESEGATQQKSTHLQEEAAALKVTIKELKNNNKQFDARMRNLLQEMESQKEQNKRKQEMIYEGQKSIEQLKEHFVQNSEELSELQIALNEAKMKEHRVRNDLRILQEENSRLKDSKEQLLKEADGWSERQRELDEQIQLQQKSHKDLEEALAYKENEIEVLTNCIMQLKQLEEDSGAGGDDNWQPAGDGELENGEVPEIRKEKMKTQIKQMMDVSRVKTTLSIIEEEKDLYQRKLSDEVSARHDLEEQIKQLQHDTSSLQSNKTRLDNECKTLRQKVEILTELYQQKEMALQKKLTQEEYERQEKEQKLSVADEKAIVASEEVKIYKQRIQEMEEELQKTERSFKNQIASHEKKAHENWLTARTAERTLAEEKRESANLRQKLIEVNQKITALQRPSIVKPTPGRPDHQPPPRRGTLSRDGSFGPSPVSGGAPSPPMMMDASVRSASANLSRSEDLKGGADTSGPRRSHPELSGRTSAPVDLGHSNAVLNSGPRTSSPAVGVDGLPIPSNESEVPSLPASSPQSEEAAPVMPVAKGPPSFPGTPVMNSPAARLMGPPPPRGSFGPRPLPQMHGPPLGVRDFPPRPMIPPGAMHPPDSRGFIRGPFPPGPGPMHGPRDYPMPHPGVRDFPPGLPPPGLRDFPPGARDFPPGLPPPGARDYPPGQIPPGLRDFPPGPLPPGARDIPPGLPHPGPRDYPPVMHPPGSREFIPGVPPHGARDFLPGPPPGSREFLAGARDFPPHGPHPTGVRDFPPGSHPGVPAGPSLQERRALPPGHGQPVHTDHELSQGQKS